MKFSKQHPATGFGRLLFIIMIGLVATGLAWAQAGGFTKAVVEDHIKKVEDGVDDFRDYLENRGDTARNSAQTAQDSGATRRRAPAANTEARKDQASRTKDDLDNALDDLNGATNRLRRRFGPASNYMDTKRQMEDVMESARRVNQVMVKGNYGTQAERVWTPLRKYINDLARCYGLPPLGV
ncbi:MAG TPA: hypothetical protein VFR18_07760 [Terriglobia bacterium]|nr:hypothetical protein [Terriglobia bacterium]